MLQYYHGVLTLFSKKKASRTAINHFSKFMSIHDALTIFFPQTKLIQTATEGKTTLPKFYHTFSVQTKIKTIILIILRFYSIFSCDLLMYQLDFERLFSELQIWNTQKNCRIAKCTTCTSYLHSFY